jgi:hypothetical protein
LRTGPPFQFFCQSLVERRPTDQGFGNIIDEIEVIRLEQLGPGRDIHTVNRVVPNTPDVVGQDFTTKLFVGSGHNTFGRSFCGAPVPFEIGPAKMAYLYRYRFVWTINVQFPLAFDVWDVRFPLV